MITFKNLRTVRRYLGMCMLASTLLAGCMTIDSPLSPRGPQRRMYLGPTGGFSVNTTSGQYHSQTAEPDCNGFSGGSGSGLVAGAAFEYWFAQRLSSNGIVARIMYEQKPSTFTSDYGTVPFWNPNTKKAEPVAENLVADVSYNLINARIAYMFAIPKTTFALELGPTLGVTAGMNVKQSLNIDASRSPDAIFPDGSQSQVRYNGTPSSKSGVRFGLWAGAQYKYDIDWWILSPYLGFDLGLTKTLSTESWSVSSLVIGVDVKYGIK